MLATLSRWRSWVQIPSGTLDNASACRHNHGPLVYRRRTPAPHAGRMGSTPIRANELFRRQSFSDQVVELADTRRSERRAFGRGSSTLPLVTGLVGQVFNLPLSQRQVENLPYSGWSSPVVAHIHRPPGATPGPATRGRVRKPAKRPGREPGEGLWVRLPPRSLVRHWSLVIRLRE